MADNLVSKLLEMLFQMAKDELTMQMGLTVDVNKLQLNLEKLQCFLKDAEKKRIEDASTNLWLKQSKDVMYDIEDVLDEYHALHLSRSGAHDNSGSSSTPTHRRPYKEVCRSIRLHFKKPVSKHNIGVQIAELNKRLTEIMGEIPRLKLLRSFPTIDPNQAAHNQLAARMTRPSVVPTDIVGPYIHNDVRCLVETLTEQDDRDNPLVCAIVGMGGIGKTTRAELVFDDPTIKNCFDQMVWVRVSQSYDVLDILRSIISSAGGDDKQCHDPNLLSEKVMVSLQGKRLFMVLDDLWETEKLWKGVLRSLLKSAAAKGSRVLVTTRNMKVAHQMMAIHAVQVEPLPLEDGWSLLCKSAFPVWQQQEAKDDVWNLRDIGMKLVKKCDGLPLAINIIGGMLSAVSRTKKAWKLVLKSSAWEVNGLPEEIHSALYISYQNLPSNIKQCFLYCSLFPNNDCFSSAEAKKLWIHEGLIKDDTYAELLGVAGSYISILLQRNLLMVKPRGVTSLPISLSMHDLVYSLTQFLMQNESLVATGEESLNNIFIGRTMKLRRLSFVGGGVKTMNNLPKNLKEQVSLRTLLIFDKSICEIDKDLFNHLPRLRTLRLENTNVSSLPDSLGSLKLLRYLNLSNTPIRELPKTIKKLKSLRSLDVSNCVNLCNLPSGVTKLHCICSLLTKGSGLTHIPPGLGRLNKLQYLDFIMPSEEATPKSSTIQELGTLTELRELGLCKLERMLDRSQAKSANLKDKNHLRTLKLCCSKSDSNQVLMNNTQAKEVADKIVEIFEDLCPHPELNALIFENYYGSKLPNWLGDASFDCLSVLQIIDCNYFKQLNGLGLLPSLEVLNIIGASSIKSIGPAFYTGNDKSNIENCTFFPRMKVLMFLKMDSWEEWIGSSGKAKRMMPKLEELIIAECPKLKSFPRELLHHAAKSLKKIRIYKTRKLHLKVVHKLPRLELLVLQNLPKLERISRLRNLQDLCIVDCPGIKSMKLEQHLRFIKWDDFNTDSLPGWFPTDDGYGNENRLKAIFLGISCKEELVSKICLKGQNEADEMSKIFQHFDNIAVCNEERLRLSYTKNPRNFIVHPVEAPEIIQKVE
ncbi:putative disease resistance RPP13-like protein 1 [Phalaenopsis equestris]|uniref:putative disease resistance RPP13-like protein 1 n=1 Tax=Phalaenopsis equestris TaxID=78828 RepID=UPI0009E302F6|nr:putative disease resistance RPP13-like protein 1 [Phalaenopsis equestris]